MFDSGEKIAIGTAQFGMPYGIANRNGQVLGDEITAIIDLSWEKGIDTLDTAKAYGTSEEAIGSYLMVHSNIPWQIITKISNLNKSISDQLQDSVQKLSVCPAALLAHSADIFLNKIFQEGLKVIIKEKFKLKTGVSLYNTNEIERVLESNYIPDIIQLPMNILDTKLYRHGTLSRLFEKGIEIHVRSAFLQGLFYLSKSDLEVRFKDAILYLEKLKSISAKADLTLPELSLLWLASLKEVSKIIIGVDNVNQLKVHLKTLKKDVDPSIFEEALLIHYENENILNPSLWPEKS